MLAKEIKYYHVEKLHFGVLICEPLIVHSSPKQKIAKMYLEKSQTIAGPTTDHHDNEKFGMDH